LIRRVNKDMTLFFNYFYWDTVMMDDDGVCRQMNTGKMKNFSFKIRTHEFWKEK